uniref:condensation domain-containing protein n=1 Tax=Massilia sp. TaxID=1882437 RepID=UPI00352FB4FC
MNKLLSALSEAGIQLVVTDGKLKLRGAKGDMAAHLVEEVRRNREQLLAYLGSTEQLMRDVTLRQSAVIRQERDGASLPLSYAQQRLWFLDQLGEGTSHYNLPMVFHVEGEFDKHCAQQAIVRILARHEPLRTVFAMADGEARQIVREPDGFAMECVDLSGMEPVQQEQAVQEAIIADSAAFDLSEDLMVRARFLDLGSRRGVFLINMHHIASDGWSMSILVKEFVAQYRALRECLPDPFSPLSIRYSDYAQWQRDWMSGPRLEEQLAYWENQLAGIPLVHSLPLAHPRPQLQRHRGARTEVQLNADLRGALGDLAQRRQVTMFMVLHGALSILLAGFGSANDVVIGVPVANRTQKELEDIIGFFVNTLVLRVDCSGNPSFTAFLEKVKAVNVDAQLNQDVPFDRLVERIKPARSLAYSPLYQIVFTMETGAAEEALALSGAKLSPIVPDEVAAKFDLVITASESERGIRVCMDYDTDLFELATIDAMAAGLQEVLHAIVRDPSVPIANMPLLPSGKQEALLRVVHDDCRHFPQT